MIKDFDKIFTALGEPTRLKIIKLLVVQKLCVCELSAVLEMLQPRVSQHLRVLKEAELVVEQREGAWTYYNVNREKLDEAFRSFAIFLTEDLSVLSDFKKEKENLINLSGNSKVKATKSLLNSKKEA